MLRTIGAWQGFPLETGGSVIVTPMDMSSNQPFHMG